MSIDIDRPVVRSEGRQRQTIFPGDVSDARIVELITDGNRLFYPRGGDHEPISLDAGGCRFENPVLAGHKELFHLAAFDRQSIRGVRTRDNDVIVSDLYTGI